MRRIFSSWHGISLLVLVVVALTNLLNLIFQLIAARGLGVTDFSLFSTVMVFIGIIGVATSALQISVSTSVARNKHRIREKASSTFPTLDAFTRHTIWISVVVGIVFLILSPIVNIFTATGFGINCCLCGFIVISAITSIATGKFQGNGQILAVTSLTLLLTLGKLLSLLPLKWNAGVTTVIMVLVGTTALIALVGLRLSRFSGTVKSSPPSRSTRIAMVTLVLFWLISGMDIVSSHIFLEPREAGEYAAASTLARMNLVVPAIIATAMLPAFTRLRSQGADLQPLLRRSLGVTVAVLAAQCILIWLTENWLLSLLFGQAYGAASSLVFPLSVAFSMLAITWLLVQFALSGQGKFQIFTLSFVPIVGGMAFALVYPGLWSFTIITLCISGLALVGILVPTIRESVSQRIAQVERDPIS